jgi:hypothetical protein
MADKLGSFKPNNRCIEIGNSELPRLLSLGVDPGCGWQAGGRGLADETLGMVLIGGSQDAGAAGLDGCGCAVVNVGSGVHARAAMAVAGVVPGKNVWQCARAARVEAKRAGKPGRYFMVLNCASENGFVRRAALSATG